MLIILGIDALKHTILTNRSTRVDQIYLNVLKYILQVNNPDSLLAAL